MTPSNSRPTVAVVGSGVAGLTAAHLLQRQFDVQLFEADDRLGGHAHTHDVAMTNGQVAGLDSAFLVTTTAPTRTCCGCSPNSASPPRTPRCR